MFLLPLDSFPQGPARLSDVLSCLWANVAEQWSLPRALYSPKDHLARGGGGGRLACGIPWAEGEVTLPNITAQQALKVGCKRPGS